MDPGRNPESGFRWALKRPVRDLFFWVYRNLGDFSLGRGPVGGSSSLGKCQLGDFNLSDFLRTIFILIHSYLMDATNEHYFLNKTYLINNEF